MSPRRESVILHVDMDAFYASVEVLDDPGLAGRPVIVGGTGPRGVVASCSYEARARGVRSALPTARARRLCPDAVFLPPRFDAYRRYSARVHEILGSFTPLVEGIALDEAFLDVTGSRRLQGDPESVAKRIRHRIGVELGLSASVGVAPSKLLAKLASEAAKPRASPSGPEPGLGVKVVAPGDELAFLHPHPVRALWGVGPATARRLARFGVRTVGDLAQLPEETLVGALGAAAGHHLHELSWARDESPVEPDRQARSVSQEETFGRDEFEGTVLERESGRLATGVAVRLDESMRAGRTVTLKVRFASFRTITRSRTLPEATGSAAVLGRVAAELLAAVDVSEGVRLLGVGVSNLVDAPGLQLSLEEESAGDGDRRRDGAARAVDAVRQRFGRDAVGPGKPGV